MIRKYLLYVLLAATAVAKPLTIYWIDTEGGGATLLVTPAGESILIDTGHRDDRDPASIAEAAKQAGLKQIDNVIITHWHADHFGGVEGLNKLIPLRRFYDHGMLETLPENPKQYALLKAAYLKVTGGHSTTVNAGEKIPLRKSDSGESVEIRCMVSNQRTTAAPKLQNSLCEKSGTRKEDKSDNANSLALKITYGRFSMFDGGDLTWDVEQKAVCPGNTIGQVVLYQTDGHGMDTANDETFIHSLRPRVVVANNGPKKGAEPKSMRAIFSSPGLETVWQIHRNLKDADTRNTDAKFIANEKEACSATFIKAVVEPSGGFTMQIGATGTPQEYKYK